MVIYLDLVLGLNFIIDLLLLLGTNRLCGFSPGVVRAAAAAALGAVYGAWALLSGFSFLGNGFWRIVFLLLMGIIAFGWNPAGWRRIGIFLLLSLAMGGMALGISREGIPALLLSASSVWLLSRVGFGGSAGGREYIPITVTEGERSISVIALKDTGNGLRDPITGEQVIVLGPEAAMKLLDLTREALSSPLDTVQKYPGLRLIPYCAVGQPGGLLVGKRFSSVKLDQRENSALVAFAPEPIGAGQIFQALAGGKL